MSDRFKIILVKRYKRYRKVTRKGGFHNRKYRPLMVPVMTLLIMGAGARAYVDAHALKDATPSPYFDPLNPNRPRIVEFSPELWARTKLKHPEFADKCDLFERVVVAGDILSEERDIPILP